MARKLFILLIFFLTAAAGINAFTYKKSARPALLTNTNVQEYPVKPHFAAAEICTVRHDQGAAWRISHWVTGDELYKSFQDPAVSCNGAYPFSVEYVYMVFNVWDLCTLYVSVDVETADRSNPACPVPGNVLSISQLYEVIVPGAGLYQLEIPLDTPVTVNGSYFAGFFIANYVDTLAGMELITDDFPTACVNYNIWDTAIGYVDLDNTGFPTFPQFPGRILLYSAGTPGGSQQEPEPSITIIKPEYNEKMTGAVFITAAETSGSNIIDSVRFQYRKSSGWTRIGVDGDGSQPLRNGVDASGSGNGFSIDWNYSVLSEGNYWLSARVFDSLGRTDVDSIPVAVDPTPPYPTLVTPESFASICLPLTLAASSSDENLIAVKFEMKSAATARQITVTTLDQNNYGDTNGNPHDGNPSANGEYGDYYCGPAAAAMAIKYWFDQGYIYTMREGGQFISVDTLVERLAAAMHTRLDKGTYDDMFLYGFQQYNLTHGNQLLLDMHRHPNYAGFRVLFEEEEKLPILGLGGTPGVYLTATGFTGLADDLDRFAVRAADPRSGGLLDLYIRNTAGGAEVNYGGTWHPLDVIITVIGDDHTVTREYIGADNSATGGWTFNWTSSSMSEDSLYFITATAMDATGRNESATSLVTDDCLSDYPKGDYNGDDVVNVGDALYLSQFIYKAGPPPVGGAGRADANCDGSIDISDVLFVIRYIYSHLAEPCY
jgi:hypothetical protein